MMTLKTRSAKIARQGAQGMIRGAHEASEATSSTTMRDALARARRSAFLESEKRFVLIWVSTIVLASLHRFLPGHRGNEVLTLNAAVALGVVGTLANFGMRAYARRFDADSMRRRVLIIGPVVAHVLVWSILMSAASVQRAELAAATFMVATFALSSTAVMVGQSGLPAMAMTFVLLLMVPLGTALIGWGTPEMKPLGGGTLFYAFMLGTFLPRVARERRARLMTVVILEERGRALEQARDAALKAAAAKDAFHANLSHEIRTPLNGLAGVVDKLRRTALDPDQREALEQLDRCGQSLLLILNDALDAVSIEAGQLKLRAEPFGLQALLRDAVSLFEAQAAAKGLSLRLVAGEGARSTDRRVIGDPQRIRQVLQNLVGNAVKFTERGSVVVEADVAAIDDAHLELVVVVSDTGPGFDVDDGAQLFARFSQGRAGRQRGGTGLGLAISRELVALMGGEIDGESKGRDQGARFVVRVPLGVAAREAPSDLAGRRVLIVDDNPLNLAVARAYLEVLGCVVDRASSGSEAVQLASAHEYDAILMDCLMPGVSGSEATAQIRAVRPTARIIGCTASEDADTERTAKAAGMQGLIHKPVSSEALRAALLRT